MTMQDTPAPVHLVDILDRPRWLDTFEQWRNKYKHTPFLMELWAELV